MQNSIITNFRNWGQFLWNQGHAIKNYTFTYIDGEKTSSAGCRCCVCSDKASSLWDPGVRIPSAEPPCKKINKKSSVRSGNHSPHKTTPSHPYVCPHIFLVKTVTRTLATGIALPCENSHTWLQTWQESDDSIILLGKYGSFENAWFALIQVIHVVKYKTVH